MLGSRFAGGVVVGIVSYPVVFIFGIIALIASAAEWMVQAWSERASADGEFNAVVRARISHPLEFPVLAFVGAVQLSRFGAQIYVADLVAVAMVREMGCIMTAIIMAGRTGSGFAAQLGTMRVTLRLGRTIRTLLSAALLAGGLRSGAILTWTIVAIFATLALEAPVRLE